MDNSKADAAGVVKSRTLESFLLSESASFADFAKQRQSVDLEKLFFGQDGTCAIDGGDDESGDDNDGGDAGNEKKDGKGEKEGKDQSQQADNAKVVVL